MEEEEKPPVWTNEQLVHKLAEVHAGFFAHRVILMYLLRSECLAKDRPLQRAAQLRDLALKSIESFAIGDPEDPPPQRAIDATRANAAVEARTIFQGLDTALRGPTPTTPKKRSH